MWLYSNSNSSYWITVCARACGNVHGEPSGLTAASTIDGKGAQGREDESDFSIHVVADLRFCLVRTV